MAIVAPKIMFIVEFEILNSCVQVFLFKRVVVTPHKLVCVNCTVVSH